MNTTKVKQTISAINSLDLKGIKDKQAKYEASFMNIPQTDPWVPLVLKGEEWKLEFSYEAAQSVLRLTGKNIFAGELRESDLANMDMLVGVLVCGLKTHSQDVTIEAIAPLLTLKHRMYYAHCISKALEVTQPDFAQLQDMLGDVQNMTKALQDLEAGDTTAPLPEIVPSPISGEHAE